MTTPTIKALAGLQKSLDGKRTLSIYFSAKSNNPSQRNNWRARLRSALRKLRASLDANDHDDLRQFDAAAAEFQALDIGELRRADGVVCFVTAAGLEHIERLPFVIEPTAVWGTGIALAPYVRALKQQRPVILAVADGQSAWIGRYLSGPLIELETFHVEPHLRQPTHMSTRVGPKFHPGTRGIAGQDESQREWSAATTRLARRLARQIAHHAGNDAWVVLGGRPDVVSRTEAALPRGVRVRVIEAADISVHSASHELEQAARTGASALREAADARALQHLVDVGDEGRGAAIGENAARRALDSAAVSQLYLSSRFVAENASRAELAVRSAIDQGADIETVSGEAGATLDSMGGIAARLRYALAR